MKTTMWQKEKVEAYLEALQNKRKEKAGERDFERRRIRREGEKKQRFGHFGILCHRWFGESPVFVGGLRVVFEDLRRAAGFARREEVYTRGFRDVTFLSIITLVSRISCSIGIKTRLNF